MCRRYKYATKRPLLSTIEVQQNQGTCKSSDDCLLRKDTLGAFDWLYSRMRNTCFGFHYTLKSRYMVDITGCLLAIRDRRILGLLPRNLTLLKSSVANDNFFFRRRAFFKVFSCHITPYSCYNRTSTCDHLLKATTSHKGPPSQNTKNVLSQSVILEPLLVRVQIQACEKPTG